MEIQHHSLQHHNEAGMDPNTHSTLKVLNFRDVCKVVAVVSQLFVPFGNKNISAKQNFNTRNKACK